MGKKSVLKIIIALVTIVVIFAGGFLLGFNFISLKASIFQSGLNKNAETNSSETRNNSEDILSIKSIEDTINLVLSNAINIKTKNELISAAIKGVIDSLGDKYADYFPRDEYNRILDSYSGTMSGIGIVVTADDKGQVLVVKTIADSPAFKKGIKEGDIIVAVEGKDIKGMTLDTVISLIRGKEGTDVNITILRPSDNINLDFKITRERFYVPNYYAEVLEGNIAYIQYTDFQENGAKQMDKELKKIIDGGAEGIILDLRNNLGGVVVDAVDLCDLFLDKGIIVTVKGRSNNKDSFEEFKAKSGGYIEIPMIVLINGYSASASELTAGALRDNHRAVLIGEKSFGKGTVQILESLSDGSGIKFTTAKYYLPSGVTIDGIGVQPDILVPLTPEDKEDLQLNRAIEEMKKMIEKNVPKD
ncbi:MAG: S41 family peptidase [Actinobacteria bacterium]|nr:S41 family peptidase [Actinomycetota bacterium]